METLAGSNLPIKPTFKASKTLGLIKPKCGVKKKGDKKKESDQKVIPSFSKEMNKSFQVIKSVHDLKFVSEETENYISTASEMPVASIPPNIEVIAVGPKVTLG